MKRKIFSSLFLFLIAASSICATNVSSLVVDYCSMEKYLDSSFSFILFKFRDVDRGFTIIGDSVATLYCEGEVATTGEFTVYDSYIYAKFDPIMLPKGKIYHLQLPAGIVALESDRSIVNEEYNVSFEILEYLQAKTHSIENGESVICTNHITFRFWHETKEDMNVEVFLLREGTPVRKKVAYSGWDWDYGQVHVTWDNKLYFEAGVNYSLVLPEGAVCSRHREDIINQEERIDFVGGSDKTFPELQYSWCSLNESEAVEALNEVQWGYTERVALSLAPQIELRTDANELLKTVVPTLAEVEGEWVMTADFENYAIDPNQVYHLVIPESTVVTPDGDVVVNKETSLRIANGVVGIDHATRDALAITCTNNHLHIEGTTPGDPVALYTIEGKAITTQVAQGTSVVMELPYKGLFIVVVNGKAHKVVNG